MEGWIKIYRKFADWEWYQDGNTTRVFLHLLITVNFEEKKWKGITVKRGQTITGRKVLAEDLNLSEMQIRTALTRLKSTNEITIKTTNKFSIVTICKFEDYQEVLIEGNQDNNQQRNQQVTTTKERKEEKNKKEKVEKEKFDISETPPENFSSPKFRKVWKEWISFRRESGWSTKESYLKSATRNLDKLAGDNTSTAVKIIQYSMDQGYQGLFALKDDTRRPNPRNGAKKPEGHFDHIKSRTIQL